MAHCLCLCSIGLAYMLHFTDQESHEGERPKERHPIPAIKMKK